MKAVVIILGMWLLSNILFVIVMARPRKLRKSDSTFSPNTSFAPEKINNGVNPHDEEEELSISHVIASLGIGAFFALSVPIAQAADSVKRAFKERPTR